MENTNTSNPNELHWIYKLAFMIWIIAAAYLILVDFPRTIVELV